jgi:hypothetical protein
LDVSGFALLTYFTYLTRVTAIRERGGKSSELAVLRGCPLSITKVKSHKQYSSYNQLHRPTDKSNINMLPTKHVGLVLILVGKPKHTQYIL